MKLNHILSCLLLATAVTAKAAPQNRFPIPIEIWVNGTEYKAGENKIKSKLMVDSCLGDALHSSLRIVTNKNRTQLIDLENALNKIGKTSKLLIDVFDQNIHIAVFVERKMYSETKREGVLLQIATTAPCTNSKWDMMQFEEGTAIVLGRIIDKERAKVVGAGAQFKWNEGIGQEPSAAK